MVTGCAVPSMTLPNAPAILDGFGQVGRSWVLPGRSQRGVGRADGPTNQLLIVTDGRWRFFMPHTRMRTRIASQGVEAVFRGKARGNGVTGRLAR